MLEDTETDLRWSISGQWLRLVAELIIIQGLTNGRTLPLFPALMASHMPAVVKITQWTRDARFTTETVRDRAEALYSS